HASVDDAAHDHGHQARDAPLHGRRPLDLRSARPRPHLRRTAPPAAGEPELPPLLTRANTVYPGALQSEGALVVRAETAAPFTLVTSSPWRGERRGPAATCGSCPISCFARSTSRRCRCTSSTGRARSSG